MVYKVTMTVLDDKRRTGRTSFNMPDASSLPEVIAYAEANLQVIDQLILGQITNCSVTFNMDISGLGLKITPNAFADVEEKMKLQYNTGGGSVTLSLPAFNENFSSLVARSNYRVLDFLQPEPNQLTGLHLNPVANGHPRGLSDNRGEQAVTLKRTRQVYFARGGK